MATKTTSDETHLLGRSLHFQTRQVVYNIYTYMKKRKLDPTSYEHQQDLNLVNAISAMTGVSKSSVSRIIRKGNYMKYENGVVCFKEEGPKKHIRKKRIEITKTTEGIIRRKVIQFYTVKKEVPSIRKLNSILKEENILRCSNEYLRQLLHRLGFTNSEKECDGLLMEQEDLVAQRLSYVRAIKGYRDQNRSIFIVSDTSSWENFENAHYDAHKSLPMIIVINMGGAGFTDNSGIVKIKCKQSKGEELKHFEVYNWVKVSVLSVLPPCSVVVMNASIFEAYPDNDEKLTLGSTRGAMQEWLMRRRIPFKETETKASLFYKISQHKDITEHNIEKLFKEHNHEILHLPQKVPDLNPALLAWDVMKNDTRKNLSPEKLFNQFSAEHWQKCFKHLKENEDEYYSHDIKMDTVNMNELKEIKVKQESENNEDEDDSMNNSDSDDSMKEEV